MAKLQTLSDDALDSAYAASHRLNDLAGLATYGGEIIRRQTSPFSFVSGLFGAVRFPLYESLTKFSMANAARASVNESAGDVAKAASGAIGSIGDYARPFIILGIFVAGVVVYNAIKKD